VSRHSASGGLDVGPPAALPVLAEHLYLDARDAAGSCASRRAARTGQCSPASAPNTCKTSARTSRSSSVTSSPAAMPDSVPARCRSTRAAVRIRSASFPFARNVRVVGLASDAPRRIPTPL